MQKDGNILVSIIILTYNNLDCLSKALESCLNQNYPLMEIVISDDGSKAFDAKKVKDIIKRTCGDKKIIVRHSEKNEGTVRNFNKAIALANGEIIVPLACDDFFYNEEVISKIVDFFRQNDYLVVTSRQLHKKADGRRLILPHLLDEKRIKSENGYKIWLSISAFPCYVGGSCTYYRKDVFKRYGLFDETYLLLEDWPYYLKILEHDRKIGFLDCITIQHNAGGVSAPKSGKRNSKLVNDDIKCIERVITCTKWGRIPFWDMRLLQYRYQSLKQEKNTSKFYFSFGYLDVIIYKIVRRIVRNIVTLIFENRK